MDLIELAKKTVETFVKEKRVIKTPNDLPESFLKGKAGTFVTIKKKGQLRGCIGTYLPTRDNIAQEVIKNAISAATEDYRFGPITKEDLPYLSYTVYILNKPEPIKSINDLNPKKFGIIVKTVPIVSPRPKGETRPKRAANETDVVFNGHLPHKSGLLLPDLTGIDTVEKQILIACQKGKINPEKEKIIIYKFTVEKF